MSLPDATAEPPQQKQGGFRGDVLRLATGTGIGQLIGILAAPVITRLFAPEAYGLAALFASLTAILSVVACARYELSIVLPEKDHQAANLFWLSVLSAMTFASMAFLAVWFGGPNILRWINAPELGPYLWLLPAAILIHGLFAALNYWNTRTGHFTRLSVAEITSRVSGTAATLGAGFTGFATAGAMIIASTFGSALATGVLGCQIFRDNGRFLLNSFDRREILSGMKQHRRFPIYSSWASLINVASWQLPILLFGIFFSSAVVGFYALGFRILQMPMSLIGRAIGRVFHQRAARAHLSGDLGTLVRNLLRTLAIAGLAPIIALAMVGEDLFSLAFGSNWAEAGVYAQILSPWAFVWFISSPLSTLFGVLEQQAQGLVLQISIFVSRLISIGVGAYYENVLLALALFSASGIVVYGNLVLRIMRLAGISPSSMMDSALSKAMCLAAGMLLLLLTTKATLVDGPLLVGIGFLSTMGYFLFLRNELSSTAIAEFESESHS